MKVLVIDDEKSIRMALKVALSKLGLEVLDADSGEEGLILFQEGNPVVAIVDIKLPGIDGIEVLRQIKRMSPSCHVIMITYISEVRLAVEAMKIGADDYFTKPFKLEDIKKAISDLERKVDAEKHDFTTPVDVKRIVGNNPKLEKMVKKVITLVDMEQQISVLITGESGTGKELVARAIHSMSAKVDHPFVALNCPAIPKNLQESELFGYKKGAFTDAKMDKKGLLEEAGRGTLFLDEIGDMDLSLQATLLRVLQEKKFRPVGGNRELDFKANIICATNKNLQKEIEQGNFRLDLYYRINIIPISLKPLRERKEDIPILVKEFIELFNNKFKNNVKGFSPGAMKMMQAYDWPGNIRQLRNVIERIMVFQDEQSIDEKDLPEEIKQVNPELSSMSQLDLVEAKAIHGILEKNNWNITASSKELGISRLTLRRKIERYDIRKM